MVGFDLAHAVGNMPVALHDSGRRLCGVVQLQVPQQPGRVPSAVCFVHERHAQTDATAFCRLVGPPTGHTLPDATRVCRPAGAEGWQLSNPPILAMAPLRVSLALFQRAGMAALRAKSQRLTGYLQWLIERDHDRVLEVVTPSVPAQRGCQLRLRVKGPRDAGRSLFEHLTAQGIIGDWREPDIIRIAPTPLYNCYSDCLGFVQAVARWRDNG